MMTRATGSADMRRILLVIGTEAGVIGGGDAFSPGHYATALEVAAQGRM